MDADQTSCVRCGRLILKATAEKMEGCCVPCAMGTREAIDRSREERQKNRERPDPLSVYWKDLATRAVRKPDGFEKLAETERWYFSMEMLFREVLNGGFEQYFWNSWSKYLPEAERGLREIGCNSAIEVLRRAISAGFGAEPFPIDPDIRRSVIRRREESGLVSSYDEEQLKLLTDALDEIGEEYSAKARAFAVSNGFIV